jgi:hypothetical protein
MSTMKILGLNVIGGFVGTIAGGPGHLGAGQKRNYAPVRKLVEPPLSGRREVTISETNRGAVRQLDAGNQLCCVLIAKETDRHL